MKYYSTNKIAKEATLQQAVVKGLASDKGLFMPEQIKTLPQSFFDNIENLFYNVFENIEMEVIVMNTGTNTTPINEDLNVVKYEVTNEMRIIQ